MRRAPLAASLLAAALAGCGDEEEKSSGSVTVRAGTLVVVEGDEYSFKPGTITVRGAGGKEVPVRFELQNVGSLPHDIHVREGDEELGGTEAIPDGDTARATVTLARGSYELYCSIGDHADLGMTGELKIE
jgi:plastocyanin